MLPEALTLLALAAPAAAAAPSTLSATVAASSTVPAAAATASVEPAPATATVATGAQAEAPPPPGGPPPPEALVAIGADASVSVSWLPSPAAGILGYNVYRSTREGDYGAVPVNRSLVTGTEFVDNEGNSTGAPENGTTYWYTVQAVDEQGRLSGRSEEARARPEGAPVISEIPKVDYGFGESQLSVSGRKVVSLGYTIRTPKNAPGSSQLSGAQSQRLDLQQQLQVRLNGTVGKKITVDVDYDDTAPDTTRQRISVVYAGEPTETIERAEFGDIRLQLSDTEFTGYDKQLFGVRLQAKPVEKLRVTGIATQTQGINASETFVGSNSRPPDLTKNDNDYIAYRYFYITNPDTAALHKDSGGRRIEPGSEQVWLDDGDSTNNPPCGTPGYGCVGSFRFERLRQGVDYSIDYTTGVIVFNRSVTDKSMIAVSFNYGDGTQVPFAGGLGSFVETETACNLKSNWDISSTFWAETTRDAHLIFDGPHTKAGDAHMITNRYQLGYRNIVPKDFDPEFTIRIYDANGQEVLGIAEPVLDSDFYDFGVLTLRGAPGRGDQNRADALPYNRHTNPGELTCGSGDPRLANFPDRCGAPLPCPGSPPSDEFAEPPASEQPFAWDTLNTPWLNGGGGYARNGNAYQYGSSSRYPSPRYTIKLRFLTRVTSYRLRNISIVRGSERITLDGRILQRDVDYFFDYDFGQVTFLRPEQIRYDSRIQVDYEYLPFGGQFQSFLWGARAQYTLSDKTGLGGTFLSNTAQTPQDVPSATAAPKATSIAGIDGRTFLSRRDLSQVIQILPGFQKTILPLEMEIRGEVARSDINPNSFNPNTVGERGVAMIDSMEGVDDSVETGVEASSWFPASAPDGKSDADRTTQLAWKTEQGGHFSDIARTLDLHYQGLTTAKWEGLRYILSPIGQDLTKYQYLEMWVMGDGNPVTVGVSLGVVSEDANGNAQFDTEDANGDFALNAGEDTGINHDGNAFWGANGAITVNSTAYPGPGGTLLNSEDMNGNGFLDKDNRYFEYRFQLDAARFPAGVWTHVKIPLKLDKFTTGTTSASIVPTGTSVTYARSSLDPDAAVVRHVRLWLDGTGAVNPAGTVRIESVRFSGNRWRLGTTPGTALPVDSSRFDVSAISQETNAGYQPLLTFFQVRESNGERREQALVINYNLFDDAGGNYFASRPFTTPINLLDYQELRFDIQKILPINNNNGEILFLRAGGDEANYFQFNIPLDKIGSGWQTVTINLRDERNRSKVGTPTLSGARLFTFGVIRYDPPPSAVTEELWINNLRLVHPEHKVGFARKANVRMATPMGATFIADPNQEILPANVGIVVDTTYRELDNDFRTIDQPTFLQGDQHRRSFNSNARVSQIPKLPITLNATNDVAYVEDHHREDPLFFFSPDRKASSYQATVASEHLRPLSVDVSANRNEEDVRYLTGVAGADYNKVAWSAAPQIRAPLDGRLLLIPLGSNGEARATARYNKERIDYAPSRIFLNVADRTSESLDEQYDARTTYRPLSFLKKPVPFVSGLSTAPRAGYHLSRTRGIVGSLQVANITDPNSINSANRFVPVRQEITAGLDNRLDSLKGVTPSANYSGSALRDFTVQNLTTKSTLLNSLDLRPGEWWKLLSGQTFNVSYSIETGGQYYDVFSGTGAQKKTVDPVTRRVTTREMWWLDRKTDDLTTANAFSESWVAGGRMEFLHTVAVTPNWSFREDTRLQQKLRTRSTLTTAGAGVSLMKSELVGKLFGLTPLFWMKMAGFDSTYNFRKNITFDFKDLPTHVTETHQATASTGFAPVKNMTGNITCAFDHSMDLTVPAIRTITQSIRPSLGLGYSRSAGLEVPLIWWRLKLSNLFTIRHTFQMNFINNRAVGQLTGNRKVREISDFTEFEYEMLKGINLRFRAQYDQVEDFTEPQKNFKAYSFYGTFLFTF